MSYIQELSGGTASVSEYNAGNSGSSIALDFSAHSNIKLTLTANCTLTVTAPPAGTVGVLRLVQDATGSRTITRPNVMQFPNASSPTLTTIPGRGDNIWYYSDGTVMYCYLESNYTTNLNWSNTLSLTFDGVSKWVDFGNTIALDDYTIAYSISLWIKRISGSGGLITKLTAGVGFEMFDSNGVIDFGFYGNGNTLFNNNTTPIATGAWHHVVFTYDGSHDQSGIKMYIDGSLATVSGSNTKGTSVITSGGVEVGTRRTTDYWHGKMDEVTVWNGALSSGNVTTLYNSGHPADPTIVSFAANLAHYWRMGDVPDSASIIYDQVGSVNGTPTNIVSGDYTSDVP